MNILYFSQFYAPEAIASAFRATETAQIWARNGDKVTVFTGYPNYPLGRFFVGYVPKILSEEKKMGVRIIRSKLMAVPNTSTINRLKNALSYFFFGLWNIIFNISQIGKKYNVVLGTSGIVFNALLARIYAGLYNIPFVFEIRDITYVQMMATGKQKKISVQGIKLLELYLCRVASRVVVVTHGFKSILISEGVPEKKIFVITNGVNVNNVSVKHHPNTNLLLSYFGTLGKSQNINDTFMYAEVIKEIVSNLEYLLIGSGAQEDDVDAEIRASGNGWIRHFSGMPADQLETYYKKTEISIVTLRKSDNFRYTIPSKLFQIMGRGIAVMFIGPNGEAAEIVRKYRAGLILTGAPEEDKNILKDFFRQIDWRDQLYKMGQNGAKAVQENYSRTALAKDYADLLRSCASV